MKHYEIKHAKGLTNYQRGVLVDLMADLFEARSVGQLYRTVQVDLPRILRANSGTEVSEVIAYERLLTGEFHEKRLDGDNNFRKYSNPPLGVEVKDFNGKHDTKKRERLSLEEAVFNELKELKTVKQDGSVYIPVEGYFDHTSELIAVVQIDNYNSPNIREGRFLMEYIELFGRIASIRHNDKIKSLELKRRLDFDKKILRFLNVMSHKLKNILVPIGGYASILPRIILKVSGESEDLDRLQRAADCIGGGVEKVEERIDFIGEMARRTLTNRGVSFEKISLGDYVRKSIRLNSLELEKRGIDVETDLDDDLSIVGNSLLIEEALDEIVNNACRNTPINNSFRITGKHEGTDYCALKFRNTGVYRSPKDIKWSLKDGNSNRLDGERSTGSGLSYLINIIEVHGGEIRFKSEETPKKYFEAEIRLPITS